MLNLKVSLVTSSGLLLASKPEAADDTRQILATGLMTALISFSKEVHQRELQSISYHDRTVSFIRVHDFVLILETIDEESTLSEQKLRELLEKLKSCTSPLLEGADPNNVSEGEAALILDRCLQDIQLLHYSITEQPLKIADKSSFTLLHHDKGWEIKDKIGSGSHIPMIALMLDTLKANEKFKGKLANILVNFPEEKSTALIVIDTDGETSRVGVLKFSSDLDLVLFRLSSMMDRILNVLTAEKDEKSMKQILNILMDVDDPGNRLSHINMEDLSTSFLDRTVGKNLDKPIYSAIVGDPIFIVGDKPTVKLVIDSLSIFTQHLQTSVNPWITENDFSPDGKCDLSAKICGMSLPIYNILVDGEQIFEPDTVIRLDINKITGEKSSRYFKKLFDTIKKLSIAEVVTKIANELEKLVSLSLEITSLALLDETKGKQKMKEISSQSGYDSSFVKKTIELAIKRNPLLEYLVD